LSKGVVAVAIKYATALAAMAGHTPATAISGPASAGPTKRATLKHSELSPTAAVRSLRGTRPGMRDCRAGCAKEEAMPFKTSSASKV
jgi:hypothetical protein